MTKSSDRRRVRLKRLAKHQDDLCFFCDGPLVFGPRPHGPGAEQPDWASLDHFLARVNGGTSNVFNTVVAHARCNSIKGRSYATPEQQAKLDALNAIRRHHYAPDFGDAVATSYGSTQAALNLFAMVQAYPHPRHLNVRISRFLNGYNRGMKAITQTKEGFQTPFRLLWRDHHLSKVDLQFADLEIDVRTHLKNVICSTLTRIVRGIEAEADVKWLILQETRLASEKSSRP